MAERTRPFESTKGVALAKRERGRTMAVVMTCSHDTDLEVIAGLLGEPPRFVGLIGSASKRACFAGKLAARGFDEGAFARVRCPVGLGDMGKAPELVAVSMAGELLLEAKRCAAS